MPVSRKRKKPKQRPKNNTRTQPKWETFEKIVAAIHLAEMQGATVTWNEQIEGRQFDVTIRFKVGFYEYLTLIECKDFNIPIPIEKVEAFATKVRHQKADKAIMVSPHGFQKGAKEVAQKERIELYSLRQINKLSENLITNFLMTTVVIQPLGFYVGKKEVYQFSRVENKVEYQVEHIKFENWGDTTLSKVLNPLKQLIFPFPLPGVPKFGAYKRATAEMQYEQIKMAENTFMISPETGERIQIQGLYFRYWTRTGYLVDTQGIDPSVYTNLNSQYEYKNELNDEVSLIDPLTLKFGIDTVLEAGKFYHDPKFNGFIYYCEKVDDESFTMLLIQSYQHGKLVRSEMQLPISESKYFVEIVEKSEIKVATKLYKDFITFRKNNSPTVTNETSKMWVL